jgi:hypothetical protein
MPGWRPISRQLLTTVMMVSLLPADGRLYTTMSTFGCERTRRRDHGGHGPMARADAGRTCLVAAFLAVAAASWAVLMGFAPLLQVPRTLVRDSSADVSIVCCPGSGWVWGGVLRAGGRCSTGSCQLPTRWCDAPTYRQLRQSARSVRSVGAPAEALPAGAEAGLVAHYDLP